MKVCIIPARGGSKRIPRKNIRPFLGRPIIEYAIKTALNSKLFDEVIVSTDDIEIVTFSESFGVIVHHRSKENSDDFATTSDVIVEVLRDLESKNKLPETVCCIYPTSPLLDENDLNEAIEVFEKQGFDSLVSSVSFSFPPQRGFYLDDNIVQLVSAESMPKRSQDLPKQFHDAGSFYFFKSKSMLDSKNLWAGKVGAYILPESKVQDIDTEEDWKMAELKFLQLSKEKKSEFEEWSDLKYKCLQKQIYSQGEFKIVPIRSIDRHEIQKWRNEQIYHLRQDKPLSSENQENYFQNTVLPLFKENQPKQILFSFLKDNICIGYGGLVHINWIDRNAEISFVMNTSLEKDLFSFYWSNYLKLIEKVAFDEIEFHKIYTFAFDVRPHLYEVLVNSNYMEEARLKEHCFFDNKFLDVLIHSKINRFIKYRKPSIEDAALYYEWANDKTVRINSYNTSEIDYESHLNWFNAKLIDENCLMYLFQNEINDNIGQVRIQTQDNFTALIGVSIDPIQRGKGYASRLIRIASDDFLSKNKDYTIDAFIKDDNITSAKSFEKAGFILKEMLNYENVKSFHYIKKHP